MGVDMKNWVAAQAKGDIEFRSIAPRRPSTYLFKAMLKLLMSQQRVFTLREGVFGTTANIRKGVHPLFELTRKLLVTFSKAVVLNRGGTPLQRNVNQISGGCEPCVVYNMESLINKFTNKCVCLYNLFNTRGAWNKGRLLEGGVVSKRLRTTALKKFDKLQGKFQL